MGRLPTLQSKETLTNSAYTRPSILEDVIALSENMRQEDIDELKATGDTPKGCLLYCYLASKPAVTMISRHGYIMGMYGVIPEGIKSGRIWMLGHKKMVDDLRDKIWFLRESQVRLKKLHETYPLMFNIVDARNTTHVEWLKWMKFSFIQKHLLDANHLFYEFVRI